MLLERRIVVIVPALNEKDFIARVVTTMPAFVDAIIVVDDGSSDGTGDRARAAGAHVVRHDTRRGVGAALTSGYRAALDQGADVIAVMAGDGQMHPDDLERVVGPVVRGDAEYVKGERFSAPGVRQAMGWPRWVGGQAFSRLTSLAVGTSLTDTQCGYSAMSRAGARAIALEQLWPSFGYPNDLLGLCVAAGLRITEVAVRPVYGDERSNLKLRHLPPIFFLIGRAAVRARFRRVTRVTRSDDKENERLKSRRDASDYRQPDAEPHAETESPAGACSEGNRNADR